MPTPFEAAAGVTNACQILPTVLTGGQPGPAHLEALRAAGIVTVLDIRDPMEPRPFDEPARVRELGMEYVNIPVGAGSLDDATLERILATLRGAGEQPVFFHCASGNRVGGAMIAHLMLDHGMEEEDAIEQAMRMGLRGPELLEWGLHFARRHAGG
jgi:protein tyrosine phosphatase (PTP) superfamily phosphohydrolase (DUF442 family)